MLLVFSCTYFCNTPQIYWYPSTIHPHIVLTPHDRVASSETLLCNFTMFIAFHANLWIKKFFLKDLSTFPRPVLENFVRRVLHLHPKLRRELVPPPNPPIYPGGPPEAPEWCYCGRCCPMATEAEQLCCRLCQGQCILDTNAEQLHQVVCSREVLTIALRVMNNDYAYDDEPINNKLRHVAYRQYIMYKFGRLGAGSRCVLPSCVFVWTREHYPSQNGQYTGFRPVRF